MTTVVVYPTATTTALDIIRGAMSILRVLSPDSALTAEEEADGLAALNEMIDTWTLDPLNLYLTTNENVVTVAKTGNTPHTMGTGGDWNTARPIKITQATFQVSQGVDRPIQILNYDDYAVIRMKSLQVNYPQYMYVAYGWPFAQVYLYPVPGAGVPLTLWSNKPLATFNSTSDVVSLPPGYVRAMKFNLAVNLAPQFQQDLDANTLNIAATSLRQLQRANTRVPTTQLDLALVQRGRRYSIYSDGPP